METSNEAYYWILIAKRLQGEISSQEEQVLADWLEKQPERALMAKAAAAWKLTEYQTDNYAPDVAAGWQRFQTQVGIRPEQSLVSATPVIVAREVRTVRLWPVIRIAAMLLVLLGFTYVAYQYLNRAAPMLTFRADDQKKELRLPDGSLVTLNKHAQIQYAADFNRNQRMIYLSGEAFFDVKKTGGKTFTVYSGNTQTQVLGTSFNVRSDSLTSQVEVTVFTGKVAFSERDNPKATQVLLTPGYLAVAGRGKEIIRSRASVADAPIWKKNELEFNNMRLDRVIHTLERYYGISVRVTDPKLLNCRFTGFFYQPELAEILEVLSVSVNLTYSARQNQYTISGQGCN